jgi:hypothetical protein
MKQIINCQYLFHILHFQQKKKKKHHACKRGDLDAVKLLIEKGAEINKFSNKVISNISIPKNIYLSGILPNTRRGTIQPSLDLAISSKEWY